MVNEHIHVEIEPTNICNTRCVHCPHEAISRPYGKMDWEVYKSIMDKVMDYTPHFTVEYAGMGEPLLNPLIYQFIGYVSSKASATSMTTNASALTPQNMQNLIDAGLSKLTISFNGEDPEIYELMMGGLNFERAHKNLIHAIQASQGTRTKIHANVSVTRQTQDRLPELRRFLEDAGVASIYFSKCHNRGGFLKGDVICNTPPPPSDRYRCDIFKNTLFIAWTGEVLSCCHDLAGENVIGDLRTDQLNDILRNKVRIATQGVKFDICKGCNDIYRFMNDKTPDGRPISDWVYSLYSRTDHSQPITIDAQTTTSAQASSLTQWLVQIYSQENKAHQLVQDLVNQVVETGHKAQTAQENFNNDLETLEIAKNGEIQILQIQLDEIYNSRVWHLIENIQKIRLSLIPRNSKRERLFHSLWRSPKKQI